MPVTLYAAGPPGQERPALEALREVLAEAGGTSGAFRVTLSWQAVAPDAPRVAVLAAARRAVEDPRAAAYVDATGGPASAEVVQLLNLAGVAVAPVASPALRARLCRSRDPFPSGRRTAAVPEGATPAARAAAAAEALLEVLRPMPPAFDRRAMTDALVRRLSRC